MLGLVNPSFAFGGLNGAIHLAEDCFEFVRTVPQITCTNLVVGVSTAFLFAASMLYRLQDTLAAINSRAG